MAAQIGNKVGSIQISAPGERVEIWIAQDGRVHLIGSSGGVARTLADHRWYMDKLRAAAEAIQFGRAPLGFKVECKGTAGVAIRNPFYIKMLQAARDIVRHAEQQSYRNEEPDPNAVLKGHGMPYRVSNNGGK